MKDLNPEPTPVFFDETEFTILAALFAVPGALSAAELSRAIDTAPSEAVSKTEALSEKLLEADGALLIRHIGEKYELSTNEKYYDRILPITERRAVPELTDTMLEVLAIIVAKGSATRVDIEQTRGVNSDFGVGKLLEYGLIEERGRLNMPGRPMLFGPTDEVSRRFGLRDTSELEETANADESPEKEDEVGAEDIVSDRKEEIPDT